MALIHADGFDHYGTSIALTSDLYSRVAGAIIAAPAGMTGTGCYSGSNSNIVRNFGLNSNTLYAGCRLNLSSLTNGVFFAITTATYTGPGYYIYFGTAGQLILGNFRMGTVYGTSANGIYAPNSSFYLELSVKPGLAGTGQIQARLNNQLVLDVALTTGATQYGAVAQGAESPVGWTMDDLYVCDNTGTENNTFLGDRQMITSFATADDGGNQWTLTGGATGFGILDNNPPNDAQYIAGVTAGDISAFSHSPVATTAISIAGVVVYARCSKSDAGAATIGVGLESGGFSDYDTLIAPSVGFGLYQRILQLDPDGDIPWTYPKFNASKIRAERLS